MQNTKQVLTRLCYQLTNAERTINLLTNMNIDWLDDETKQHMIAVATKNRTYILSQITALRTSKKFQDYLNQRDQNILGNYKPEPGPRCQLNNEPKQPCSKG